VNTFPTGTASIQISDKEYATNEKTVGNLSSSCPIPGGWLIHNHTNSKNGHRHNSEKSTADTIWFSIWYVVKVLLKIASRRISVGPHFEATPSDNPLLRSNPINHYTAQLTQNIQYLPSIKDPGQVNYITILANPNHWPMTLILDQVSYVHDQHTCKMSRSKVRQF